MNHDINLLPSKEQDEPGVSKVLVFLIVIAGLLLGGFFAVYLPWSTKDKLDWDIAQKNKELKDHEKDVQEYKELLAKTELLEERNDILSEMKNERTLFSTFFKVIEDTIPKDMAIYKMDANVDSIIIQGVTPNYTDISQFIVRLREKDYLPRIDFDEAEIISGSSGKISSKNAKYDFTMELFMNLEEEDEKEDEEGSEEDKGDETLDKEKNSEE